MGQPAVGAALPQQARFSEPMNRPSLAPLNVAAVYAQMAATAQQQILAAGPQAYAAQPQMPPGSWSGTNNANIEHAVCDPKTERLAMDALVSPRLIAAMQE